MTTLAWTWTLNPPVEVPGDLADQTFPSQAEAETWMGEVWRDLAEAGVSDVTLRHADHTVYGPMPLSASPH